MKISILGISGRVGSRVANELLARGHQILGVARRIEGVQGRPGLTLATADVTREGAVVALIEGSDVVVSSTRFADGPTADEVIAEVKRAGVPRLLVVGGAGSLEIAPGVTLIEAPQFPEAYRAEAAAGGVFLTRLRREQDLDWTFLSPSAEFAPGERTGHFRLGGDQLLVDASGKSWISMEDYAIALADEIERPAHSRQRFTVGY